MITVGKVSFLSHFSLQLLTLRRSTAEVWISDSCVIAIVIFAFGPEMLVLVGTATFRLQTCFAHEEG